MVYRINNFQSALQYVGLHSILGRLRNKRHMDGRSQKKKLQFLKFKSEYKIAIFQFNKAEIFTTEYTKHMLFNKDLLCPRLILPVSNSVLT